MKKIISLIKTDFNITFGLSSIKYKLRNKKDRWQFIVLGLALMSLIPSYIFLIKGLGDIHDIYLSIGQRSMFLLMGFLMSQGMVLVLGLLYVMSKYYFSKDMGHLVPLPIKPSHIIGSKFVTLMISEYLTSLPIILPFIIIYGTKGNEGLAYWLYSMLLALFLPVIPLVLASIIIMIFMKYTNIGAKKDLIRTISAIFFVFIMIYFQLKMQAMANKALLGGEDFLLKLVSDSNLLVKKLGMSFPPAQWGALALSSYGDISGLLYLLVFILVGLLSFFLMIFLSEKLFFDGLIGNIEVSSSKGKKKKVDSNKLSKETRPYIALAKKEVMMLFKTPIYLMNAVGIVIMLPIIMVASSFTGDDSISLFLNSLESGSKIVSLGGVAFITAMGIMNSIGSTTFSREGRCMWIQRSLPIKVEDQILGRVLSSLFIQLIGIVTLVVSIFFIIRLSPLDILLITIFGLLGSFAMTELGMVVDIIRPFLDWDNPQRAMKQNLNVLIGMGVGSLYVGGLGFLIFKLINRLSLSLIFGLLGLVFILTSLGLFFLLKVLISKQFESLE